MSIIEYNFRSAINGFMGCTLFWVFISMILSVAALPKGAQLDVAAALLYCGTWALLIVCGTVAIAGIAFFWMIAKEVGHYL